MHECSVSGAQATSMQAKQEEQTNTTTQNNIRWYSTGGVGPLGGL